MLLSSPLPALPCLPLLSRAGKKVAAEAPADEEEDEGMADTSVAEGDEEEVDAEAERMVRWGGGHKYDGQDGPD